MKAVAVSAAKRSALLPDVPTFGEVGWGNFPGQGWWGLAAPKGTPKEVVTKLNGAFVKLFSDPKFMTFLEKQAVVPAATSPEDFAAFLKEDRKSAQALIDIAKLPRAEYKPE